MCIRDSANAEHDAHNFFKEAGSCSHLVINTNDNGPGSLREMIACASIGDTITFQNTLTGATILLNSNRLEIDKNIYIHCTVSPPVKINSSIPGAIYIDPGTAVEFKNIEITSGLAGQPGAAFENYGVLTLWDVTILRNPSLPDGHYLIFNSGSGVVVSKGMIKLEID